MNRPRPGPVPSCWARGPRMLDAASPWTGSLLLRPGAACPGNLTSTRPDLVARLAPGRLASELPGLLATLFNLCGSAHRLCAQAAVQAARQQAPACGVEQAEQAERLRVDTLREHLRRMGLDWPRQLVAAAEQPAMTAAALHALRSGPAPLTAPHATWAAERDGIAGWLARDWLGVSAESWLQAWELGPRAWLSRWAAQTDGWLPRLLHVARATADQPAPASPTLRVHRDPVALKALAASLLQPGFARRPRWQGVCAETGPWSRLHERDASRLDTPWLRLGARLAEAVRLALPDVPARSGNGWLQTGQLALPGHSGLAWVEMARGLLVHHVTLDGDGPQARVLACHVVAPTDWNFHPHGAVAQALAQLPGCANAELADTADTADTTATARDAQSTHGVQDTRRILVLMAAYDPCVPFAIAPGLCHA